MSEKKEIVDEDKVKEWSGYGMVADWTWGMCVGNFEKGPAGRQGSAIRRRLEAGLGRWVVHHLK